MIGGVNQSSVFRPWNLRAWFSSYLVSVEKKILPVCSAAKCQFVTRNHDPHKERESFRLHFSLLVKWPKNWIILGTMQMGKANDHYNYASLKFRWKRWSPYFVTSINMVILTFTPPVLHFLVLYFLLSETWKHRSCLKACGHKKKKKKTHGDTHATHTAAQIHSFYLGKVAVFFLLTYLSWY